MRRRAELAEAIVAEAEQRVVGGLDEKVTGAGVQRGGRRLERKDHSIATGESVAALSVSGKCLVAV